MLRGEVSNDDKAENLSGGVPANPFRPVAVSRSSIEQTVCCSGVCDRWLLHFNYCVGYQERGLIY